MENTNTEDWSPNKDNTESGQACWYHADLHKMNEIRILEYKQQNNPS